MTDEAKEALREPVEHDLKCWPGPFDAVESGAKPFEYRLNDRDYREGDTLLLREWTTVPAGGHYTGRSLRRRVTYCLAGQFGVPDGYIVMGLALLSPDPQRQAIEGEVVERAAIAARDWFVADDFCGEGGAPWEVSWIDAGFVDFRNPIRAALSAARLPVGDDGWLPIESAPRDKPILAGFPPSDRGPGAVFDAWWDEDSGGWVDGDTDRYGELITLGHITHWRPLPAPPARSLQLPEEASRG